MIEAIRTILDTLSPRPPTPPEVVTVPVDAMTWLEFFSSVVASAFGAAWPVAFVFVALRYKTALTRLIGRTKRFNLFGSEGEFFAEKLEDAEANADLLTPSANAPIPDANDDQDVLLSLAKMAPGAAVVEKWKEVEEWVRRRISPNVSTQRFRRFMLRPKELVELGILDFEGVAVLNDLRAMRNVAAHSRQSEKGISTDQALRYIALADQLINSDGYMQNTENTNDNE